MIHAQKLLDIQDMGTMTFDSLFKLIEQRIESEGEGPSITKGLYNTAACIRRDLKAQRKKVECGRSYDLVKDLFAMKT